jgi:hypothetical protein
MASNKTKSASVEERFGVAVSTGFRRTDPATGRTVELFLCPQKWLGDRPDQSQGFVAELKGGRARCPDCEESHPVVEFSDAVVRGFIVAKYVEDKDGNADGREGVNFGAAEIARGIRMIAGPKGTKKAAAR